MSRARRARKGQIITIIAGDHNGEKARALEDAGEKNFFRVQLTTGKHKDAVILQPAGNYIVGG